MQDATATFLNQSAGSQVQFLYDVRKTGLSVLGRVDWAALEKAYGAEKVSLAEHDVTPGLLQQGDNAGLTRQLFRNGSQVHVNVYKKG